MRIFLQVFDDASTILEVAVVVVSVGVGVGVDGAMCCNTVSLKPTNTSLKVLELDRDVTM